MRDVPDVYEEFIHDNHSDSSVTSGTFSFGSSDLIKDELEIPRNTADDQKRKTLTTAKSSSNSTQILQQPVKLRHSCESCIKSKVKCDSLKPSCSRCLKKDKSCQYLPERKRGKKRTKPSKPKSMDIITAPKNDLKVSQVISTSNKSVKDKFAWKLLEHLMYLGLKTSAKGQNICGSTFSIDFLRQMRGFQLHSKYNAKVFGGTFFENNITNLNKLLSKYDVLECFQNWSSRNKSPCKNNDVKQKDLINYFKHDKQHQYYTISPLSQVNAELYPRVTLKTGLFDAKHSAPREFEVHSNKAFQAIFGLTKEDIDRSLRDSVVGFLPYGGSVLSLVSSEKEVLKFLELQCLKVKQIVLGCNNFVKEMTEKNMRLFKARVFEVPSITQVSARVRVTSILGDREEANFLLTSMVRKVTDGCFIHDEICLEFKPLDDLSHLYSYGNSFSNEQEIKRPKFSQPPSDFYMPMSTKLFPPDDFSFEEKQDLDLYNISNDEALDEMLQDISDLNEYFE
eukprot:augustus_masked-scaffold_4-processed-gene-13.4-mRNA-1 protein AED:0.08 eAED:1.00 QI:0/-1/0/1/-1/1/1/0/508